MNNNHFALMRYFRDLGADAHVLMYSNDGIDGASHFAPEKDTWMLDKWAPYIHRTDILNAPISAVNFPLSLFFSANYALKKFNKTIGSSIASPFPVSKSSLINVFKNYPLLVGTGIAPAMLHRINRSLDIFAPYGAGIEYFKNTEFIAQLNSLSGFRLRLMLMVQARQIIGLQNARHVLDTDISIAKGSLNEIGVTPLPLACPMVYINEPMPEHAPSDALKVAMAVIKSTNFSVLHHSRLMWQKTEQFTNEQWLFQSKNNDHLIRSFAELVAQRPALKSCLLIVEYGPDIQATKELVANLGIADHVHWLPKMARRELMWLLSKVSIGVGEFLDVPRFLWGGTAWETLASGKPLLQGFQFAEGEFESLYGHPPPPMLPVRRREDILPHLLEMADNSERREALGRHAKAWFSEYNGVGLAKKWLDLLFSKEPISA